MSGVLIYTATTDSAGSLGGVLAQGEPERLAASFASAVARHGWCSADPICIESDAQGADSLNLAACHACVLLPETSCEEMNTLLDRGLLVRYPGRAGARLPVRPRAHVQLMARMFPPSILDDHGSPAERRIFRALRDQTPRGWAVIHSVGLTSHAHKQWAETDFVAIVPSGVFCLEVKGGRIRHEDGCWYTNDQPLQKARSPKPEGTLRLYGITWTIAGP